MTHKTSYTIEFIDTASDKQIWEEFGDLSSGKHFSDYASGDHSLQSAQLLREELINSGIPESLIRTQADLHRFVTRITSSLVTISR